MSDAILVEDLTKVYPNGFRAVDGVSFGVGPGTIFGFLGPNGSGKSTTVRILVTLLGRSGGRAEVHGHDVARQPTAVRRLIGYAGQYVGVDNDLTARENLVFQGQLHGLSRAAARTRAEELLEGFALQDFADRRASAGSGGLRRRLDLAQALAHRPPVLFLDEPTTGLDPQSRSALWSQLEDLRSQGTTIFMTTQYLEEADRLCDDVVIIDHGRLVASGSPAQLKRAIGGDVISVELAAGTDDATFDRTVRLLAGLGVAPPSRLGAEVVVPVRDASTTLREVVRRMDAAGVGAARIYLRTPTLDDVFLEHTGRRVIDDEPVRDRPLSSLFATIHGKG